MTCRQCGRAIARFSFKQHLYTAVYCIFHASGLPIRLYPQDAGKTSTYTLTGHIHPVHELKLIC